MKVFVGGTYQDYMRRRDEMRLSPMDAIFVGEDPHRLMGLELAQDDVVMLGPVSLEMRQLLQTRIRK